MGHQRHLLLLRTGVLQWYEPAMWSSSATRAHKLALEPKGALKLKGCKIKRGGLSASPPELDRAASADEAASHARTTKHSKSNERRQVSIYGGMELGESGAALILELADEATADEWETHLRQVILSLDAPAGGSAQSTSEGASEGSSPPASKTSPAKAAGGAQETEEDRAALRQLSEAARINHYKLVNMLDSYVGIVQTTLCDLVPKAITTRLLNQTNETINARLDPTLGRGSTARVLEELMAPSPEQAARLKRLQAEVASLRECAQVVAHVQVPAALPSEPMPPAPAAPPPLQQQRSPLAELSNGRPTAESKPLPAAARGSVRGSVLEGREQSFMSQPL